MPPDQALTKEEFIDSTGYFHNAALSNCINTIDYDQSPSTLPSRVMTNLNNYFRTYENGMVLPLGEQLYAKSFASQLVANNFQLVNPYSIDSINLYYLNQIINSGIGSQEASLLTQAKTIFRLSDSVYGSYIYDTVINRANKILAQYNSMQWSSTNGDAIGGYLQTVIKSSQYWKTYSGDSNYAIEKALVVKMGW